MENESDQGLTPYHIRRIREIRQAGEERQPTQPTDVEVLLVATKPERLRWNFALPFYRQQQREGAAPAKPQTCFRSPFALSQLCKSQPAANALPLTKPVRLRWNFALPFGANNNGRARLLPSRKPVHAPHCLQTNSANLNRPLSRRRSQKPCGSGATSPSLLLQTMHAAQVELRPPFEWEACQPFERPDEVFLGFVVLLCDVFSTVPLDGSAGTFTTGEPDDEPARRF